MLVFWLDAVINIAIFFIAIKTSGSYLLFLWVLGGIDANSQDLFFPLSNALLLVTLRLFLFIFFLSGSAMLSCSKADFGFLDLGSLEQKKSLDF